MKEQLQTASHKVNSDIWEAISDEHALTLCFLPDVIFESDLQDVVIEVLWRSGFDFIGSISLSRKQSTIVSQQLSPSDDIDHPVCYQHLIIGLDVYSKRPKDEPSAVENKRVIRARNRVDRHLATYHPEAYAMLSGGETPARSPIPFTHTKSTRESWALLEVLLPNEVEVYRKKVDEHCAAYVPPFPVVRTLKNNPTSSRTDLVEYQGQLVVCKTFLLGHLSDLENELERQRLAECFPEVPPVIASGRNWVLSPYYPDLRPLPRPYFNLMPLAIARHIFSVIDKIHAMGYAHLDFGPPNVLVTGTSDIKIIDWARLYKYESTPPPLEESPILVGYDDPLDFKAHREHRYIPTYDRSWFEFTGLSLHSMLHDPPWLQTLKRGVHILTNRIPRGVRRRVRGNES